jgi:serine/threonine protein kinase
VSFHCRACGFALARPGRCPRDGQLLIEVLASVEAPGDRMLGSVVAGKYALVGILGRGAFGHVYRAWHEVLDRDVALKIIRRSKAQGAAFRERFFLEARAVARLRGPNIVTLHDFGEDTDGRLYMVLELVSGMNVRQAVPNGVRLEPARALRLVLPVLRALSHAHAQGVVHRDLKPSNLMLTTDDEGRETVKVLDFGVAKLLDPDADGASDQETGPGARVTNHGQVIGTPRYVSPEQAVGADVGPASDLYSLGVVLFELMAGRPPFQGATPGETARLRVLEAAPPLPADVGASPALVAVVARALARVPEDRFGSAASFADAVRACPELAEGTGDRQATPLARAHTALVELHGEGTSDLGISGPSVDGGDAEQGLFEADTRRRRRVRVALLVLLAAAAGLWGARACSRTDEPGRTGTPDATRSPASGSPPSVAPPTLAPSGSGAPPTAPATQPAAPPSVPPSRRPPRPATAPAPATKIPYL